MWMVHGTLGVENSAVWLPLCHILSIFSCNECPSAFFDAHVNMAWPKRFFHTVHKYIYKERSISVPILPRIFINKMAQPNSMLLRIEIFIPILRKAEKWEIEEKF